MILRGGNVRVAVQQASPGVSGGVTLYRYQGDSAPAGTGGWGTGIWLSLDEWREMAQKVDIVLASPPTVGSPR